MRRGLPAENCGLGLMMIVISKPHVAVYCLDVIVVKPWEDTDVQLSPVNSVDVDAPPKFTAS
jgi:hypothetical protein